MRPFVSMAIQVWTPHELLLPPYQHQPGYEYHHQREFIIIIIIYFENITFFHAKLGSDICHSKVDNQPSVTLYSVQVLTQLLVNQSQSGSYPSMGVGARFWWPDALSDTYQLQIREKMLESRNLFSSRWISTSIPQFPKNYYVNCGHIHGLRQLPCQN